MKIERIPDYHYGELEAVYHGADSVVVIKAKNTTDADYDAYLKDLLDAGFTVYAENRITDRRFTTLCDEKTTVNFYYIPQNGITRVVCEDKGALYPLTDNYTDRGLPSLLTGMKGEIVIAHEGMGFIVRLRDGSFIIIDGGMGDPDSVDSDKLMNILREQAPAGEKPVIAAWLFTHLHGDHIGVFGCFSIDHHDDVILQSIYCNFPKDEETAVSDSPYMLDNTIYRYTQFRKSLKEYFSDVPVIRPHTGNRFMIRNAQIEILETLEDIVPKTILNGGMNESSVVYKMTLEGQVILWTGDLAHSSTIMLVDQFGDYIGCDFFQMAHHGMNGSIPMHKAADPTYVLMPMWGGVENYESTINAAQNRCLYESKKMKQLIHTGMGTWTIPLPYAPKEGTYDRVPNADTKNPTYADFLKQQ